MPACWRSRVSERTGRSTDADLGQHRSLASAVLQMISNGSVQSSSPRVESTWFPAKINIVMASEDLCRFSAVYCSGAYIPDAEAVTALSLLFDKVYLPNNIDIVRAFVTKYRVRSIFEGTGMSVAGISIRSEGDDPDDLLSGLTPSQTMSAKYYLARAVAFAHAFSDLYGPVFESDMFPEKTKMEIVVERAPGEGSKGSRARITNCLSFSSGDDCCIPNLLRRGYVPVVGRFHAETPVVGNNDVATTKQLATLLAMKSIEMVLPRTRAANPGIILEARHRLREQLPQFWSAMLKASVELRKLTAEGVAQLDLTREATDLVDRTIRPAVIDLSSKLESERKDWFYKILSPVRAGLRLLVGAPPLTQQQLITSAMVLASDTCMSIAENMRSIESLKREAGLAYLLDLSEILAESRAKM